MASKLKATNRPGVKVDENGKRHYSAAWKKKQRTKRLELAKLLHPELKE